MTSCCNSCRLTFTIDEVLELSFALEESQDLCFEIDEVNVVDHDPYEGPYIVIPKRVDQILATKHKSMRDDVTVTEVPWTETSNQYGTTYIITPNN